MIRIIYRVPRIKPFLTLILFVCILTGCSAGEKSGDSGPTLEGEGKIRVVATTTIIADIVKQIGGDSVTMSVLIPVGADPHSFEPSPRDITIISDAQVVFANGLKFEDFLIPIIKSAGAEHLLVELSFDIPPLTVINGTSPTQTDASEHQDDHTTLSDQHIWTDPNNVIKWVEIIEQHLSNIDPSNTEYYKENAIAYTDELEELDKWIREKINLIATNDRKIISDHMNLGHFAKQYGFTIIGALIPSSSTSAEPSAKELAALEDAIHDNQVKAIFAGNTVNHSLADQVAKDTGVNLFIILSGSLTKKDGIADNYLDYIRYNVNTIVSALK